MSVILTCLNPVSLSESPGMDETLVSSLRITVLDNVMDSKQKSTRCCSVGGLYMCICSDMVRIISVLPLIG